VSKNIPLRLLAAFLLLSFQNLFAQCMYYPVSMEQRVVNAKYIVLGKVTEKHTYIDKTTGNVNTLNKLTINAWLKNYSDLKEVYVITLGGVYGNRATQVSPSLQLDQQHEYLLMLEANNQLSDDKDFRSQHPQALQLLTYADIQGCFPNNNNSYFDLSDRTTKNEEQLFQAINRLTGQLAKKPSGDVFQPRVPVTLSTIQTDAITSFSPTTTRGGTIVPADFITITGSGFGAAPGTVSFSDADNGGAMFTASGVASDIVSWADGSITVKVPQNAGTGPIRVNGVFTSGSSLIVDYAHSAVNSPLGFSGVTTRQRYYFRNMNSLGGYTYQYNTTSGFAANAPARAAFERALVNWRCNTGINWRIGADIAAGIGADGVNVVLFDPALLPAGALARATTNSTGAATGSCNNSNTVWCAFDLDIQFRDLPAAGFTWEFGPATPSASEYDFESVALHELGHHHGLQHVISPGAVMHYALANGSFNRILSANDLAGANARMAYSTVATCTNPTACGFGPMIAIAAGVCVTLPVNLISFTGEKAGASSNKLKWSTAEEINSKSFFVQRSANGSSFADIDVVPAAGNSSQVLNYSYTDNKAGPYAWYYRLRMVDINGQEKFSSIIFIDGDQSIQWKVWADEKGDKIRLYSNAAINANAQLKIFAVNGQQVIAKTVSPGTTEIPVVNLSRGLYHFQLLYDGKMIAGKLLLGSN
jgi:Matrixin